MFSIHIHNTKIGTICICSFFETKLLDQGHDEEQIYRDRKYKEQYVVAKCKRLEENCDVMMSGTA